MLVYFSRGTQKNREPLPPQKKTKHQKKKSRRARLGDLDASSWTTFHRSLAPHPEPSGSATPQVLAPPRRGSRAAGTRRQSPETRWSRSMGCNRNRWVLKGCGSKLKSQGKPPGFSLWFHLPGKPILGTASLSHSHGPIPRTMLQEIEEGGEGCHFYGSLSNLRRVSSKWLCGFRVPAFGWLKINQRKKKGGMFFASSFFFGGGGRCAPQWNKHTFGTRRGTLPFPPLSRECILALEVSRTQFLSLIDYTQVLSGNRLE